MHVSVHSVNIDAVITLCLIDTKLLPKWTLILSEQGLTYNLWENLIDNTKMQSIELIDTWGMWQ